MQLNILAVLLFAASVLSQATVDPATNISFVRYTNPNGYSFGVALPLNVTTDFIGQIVRIDDLVFDEYFPLMQFLGLSAQGF